MTNTEAVFIWIAVWVYGASFIAFLYGVVFNRERVIGWGWYLTVAGFIPQVISVGIRWVATGHPPVMRAYENAMIGSTAILIIFWMLRRWHRRIEVVGVAIMPVILMMIGNGILKKPYLEPMAPPFKSNWLWLHIFFAWIAYGAFCIGAGMGLLYLLKKRAEEKGKREGFYKRIPEPGFMEDLMLRVIIFGFVALTVQMGAGALWAYNLWGRYWAWDPIETWSLITWLIYGIDIHLGVTLGWAGKRMAWLVIISLISLFITYGGIGYMKSVHTTMM